MQMATLSELFDETVILVPIHKANPPSGAMPLVGHNMQVKPLQLLTATGLKRRVFFPLWLLRNGPTIFRSIYSSDAVHTPIPGDVGTIGMLIAFVMRKPLFVRHCGNWFWQRTLPERFWRWFIEKFAGGKNVFMVTGDATVAASKRNPEVQWIFSTSLRETEVDELKPTPRQLDSRSPRLIIVCRQEWAKGTHIVIQSLPHLLPDYPHVHLDVVGYGNALSAFEALSREIEVQEHITFHGNVSHDEVIRLLSDADIFCFPTASSEGFPKAVLEAIACGLPVITTPVSTLPNLIEKGVGLLINEPDAMELAKAIQEIIDDPEMYTMMSAQARKTAEGYTIENWQHIIGQRLTKQWGPLQSL